MVTYRGVVFFFLISIYNFQRRLKIRLSVPGRILLSTISRRPQVQLNQFGEQVTLDVLGELFKMREHCRSFAGGSVALPLLCLGSRLYLSSGLTVILCQRQDQRSEYLPSGLGLVALHCFSFPQGHTWDFFFHSHCIYLAQFVWSVDAITVHCGGFEDN